jgi:hypothetical protein
MAKVTLTFSDNEDGMTYACSSDPHIKELQALYQGRRLRRMTPAESGAFSLIITHLFADEEAKKQMREKGLIEPGLNLALPTLG